MLGCQVTIAWRAPSIDDQRGCGAGDGGQAAAADGAGAGGAGDRGRRRGLEVSRAAAGRSAASRRDGRSAAGDRSAGGGARRRRDDWRLRRLRRRRRDHRGHAGQRTAGVRRQGHRARRQPAAPGTASASTTWRASPPTAAACSSPATAAPAITRRWRPGARAGSTSSSSTTTSCRPARRRPTRWSTRAAPTTPSRSRGSPPAASPSTWRPRCAPASGAAFDPRELLDLVALGTIADLVPLTDENRILVAAGLKVLSARKRPGLAALAERAELVDGPITAHQAAFRLTPRLNAAGRLGEAQLALDLLLASPADAPRLAEALDEQNTERQRIQELVWMEARAQAADAGRRGGRGGRRRRVAPGGGRHRRRAPGRRAGSPGHRHRLQERRGTRLGPNRPRGEPVRGARPPAAPT